MSSHSNSVFDGLAQIFGPIILFLFLAAAVINAIQEYIEDRETYKEAYKEAYQEGYESTVSVPQTFLIKGEEGSKLTPAGWCLVGSGLIFLFSINFLFRKMTKKCLVGIKHFFLKHRELLFIKKVTPDIKTKGATLKEVEAIGKKAEKFFLKQCTYDAEEQKLLLEQEAERLAYAYEKRLDELKHQFEMLNFSFVSSNPSAAC